MELRFCSQTTQKQKLDPPNISAPVHRDKSPPNRHGVPFRTAIFSSSFVAKEVGELNGVLFVETKTATATEALSLEWFWKYFELLDVVIGAARAMPDGNPVHGGFGSCA